MGRRTVEIKICIFTIEKVEKKMGGRMVEIKIYIFTTEMEKKRWVEEQWKSKSIYLL